VRRIEVVGPTVSAELKRTGVIAVIASMFGILLYVWFRFEWQFAVAAILARFPGAKLVEVRGLAAEPPESDASAAGLGDDGFIGDEAPDDSDDDS